MRSFNPEVLRKAAEPYPDIISPDFGFEGWVLNPNNVLYNLNGSVGFLTYEYPGAYTGHWFFKVRGRKALDLAKLMLDDMFTNHGAEVIRGLTKVDLKAARWASRKLGFQSLGIVSYPEGDYELFYLNKSDFYKEEG